MRASKLGDYRGLPGLRASGHARCSVSALSAQPQSVSTIGLRTHSNGRMPKWKCSNGRYTGTHVYPGVGEHKVKISVFMLPLTVPQLVSVERHNRFEAFYT